MRRYEVRVFDQLGSFQPLHPGIGSGHGHLDGVPGGFNMLDQLLWRKIPPKQDLIAYHQALYTTKPVSDLYCSLQLLSITRLILRYPCAKRDAHTQFFGYFGDIGQRAFH
ncbi:hypothetical protein A235_01054 [Pseudomonas syringae pv. actinidiae ICMP 19079]|nr:hypothetical protein A235_01054 [Pseudomonas syringae pv. actinidiae ICMP 19079]RMS16949.1 hypothetical protein ALP75_204395 [Pseudomonas syringae pv. actinidiae]